MNRNTIKIKAGIRALANDPHIIVSGTVAAGSLDEGAYTISVLPSDDSAPIEHVMLTTVTENDNGVVLFPKDESNVIIGCVDGPGEWVLLRAGELKKVIVNIGNVRYEMDDSQINIQNGSSVFNVGTAVFKMNTGSESLFQLLNDLITGLTLLTVTTPSGPSGTPINIATFSALLSRLNNLLSA